MRCTRRPAGRPARRGAILLVVLSLLALFAVIGLSFVLYAESQANAAKARKDAEAAKAGTVAPSEVAGITDEYLNTFLAQLIYDVDDIDAVGVTSGVRGHSLARTKYGWNRNNSSTSQENLSPFAGKGRFTSADTPGTVGSGLDLSEVINYGHLPGSGPIVDPEWTQTRTAAGTFNTAGRTYKNVAAPYTYPDAKDLFLAAVQPDAAGDTHANRVVREPSFHRSYLFDLSSSNPDWTSTNGRFKIIRPRPKDHAFDSGDGRGTIQDFPMPPANADGSVTGDVQNLAGTPGVQRNDSVWVYPAGPVREWNGKRYTALIAPLIIDLGGRVNLSTAGNRKTSGTDHASSMGLGPWEVNPRWVLPTDPSGSQPGKLPTTRPDASATDSQKSLQNLLSGLGTGREFTTTAGLTMVDGRYGPAGSALTPRPDPVTGVSAMAWWSQKIDVLRFLPKNYGPIDPGMAGTGPLQAVGANGTPFPTPPGGYFTADKYLPLTGSVDLSQIKDHPAQYNPVFYPPNPPVGSQGRSFHPSDLIASGARASDRPERVSVADTVRLAWPSLLADSTRYDRAKPPSSPVTLSGATGTAMQDSFNPKKPEQVGAGDPGALARMLTTPFASSTYRPELLLKDQNGKDARVGPVDISTPLPDYRAAASDKNTLAPDNLGNVDRAQLARQNLAREIFVRLAGLAGLVDGTSVMYVTDPAAADAGGLRISAATQSLRACAQLAVNIVDYIDPDDISTVFTWRTADASGANATVNPTTGMPVVGGPSPIKTSPNNIGDYVVFGTEMPRLVLSEVYAEVGNHPNDNDPANSKTPMDHNADGKPDAADNFQKRFWIELHNPIPRTKGASDAQDVLDPSVPEGGWARLHYPAGSLGVTTGNEYSPYAVVVTTGTGNVDAVGKVTGSPDAAAVELIVDKYKYDTSAANAPAPDATVTAAVQYPPNITFQAALGTTNILQYVVQPHDPAADVGGGAGNGKSATSLNGYTVLGPKINFPGQEAVGSAGTPAATIRIEPQASALNPAKQSALVVDTGVKDETSAAVTGMQPASVYLRRLANPYRSPNDPFDGTYNSALPLNPYLTVDRIENVPVHNNIVVGKDDRIAPAPVLANRAAKGRSVHPFAARSLDDQTTAVAGSPKSTFFAANASATPAANPLPWLAHLDRPPVSPVEVACVSAAAPHDVTQQFYDGATYNRHSAEGLFLPVTAAGATTFAGGPFTAGQLFRAFDLLATRPAVSQTPVGAPQSGRVNLNAVWHKNVLHALFDANAANGFTTGDVDTYWDRLNATTGTRPGRTPNGMSPSASDTPFRGFAANSDTVAKQIEQSLLRNDGTAAGVLFSTQTAGGSAAADHAYARTEPLRKVWNNTATTSDTFLVIMTVGFFEVRNDPATEATQTDGTKKVVLGKELFKESPGDMRQKFVAVVDRSHLGIDTSTGSVAPAPVQAEVVPDVADAERNVWFTTLTKEAKKGDTTIEVETNGSVYGNGMKISLQGATPKSVRIGFGDSTLNNGEGERVAVAGALSVTAADGVGTVTLGSPGLTRNHPAGTVVTNLLLGNPGPQKDFRFDKERFRGIVLVPPTPVP